MSCTSIARRYNTNRWYDPTVGRFISGDPLGMDIDTNQYRYVRNSPTNATDPTGLAEEQNVSAELEIPNFEGARVTAKVVPLSSVLFAEVGGVPVVGNGTLVTYNKNLPGFDKPAVSVITGERINGAFICSGKGGGARSPYWVQRAKTTKTSLGGGRLHTTPQDWGFDSPVADRYFPQKYKYQTEKDGTVSFEDTPNIGVGLGVADYAATLKGDNVIIRLAQTFGQITANDETIQQQTTNKYTVQFDFRSYLVDPNNFEPIGFFSWGFTVAATSGGYVIQKQAPLTWSLGRGTEWKALR